MVEDANAPPSPSEKTAKEEENNTPSEAETAGATPSRGRGRGRGRAAAAVTPSTPAAKAGSSKTEVTREASPPSTRPRRSTRAKIDYANPDAATVIGK